MEHEPFRKFLKRSGKKEHVVDGLVDQVLQFKRYLAETYGRTLDDHTPQDLLDYTAALETSRPGLSKEALRGLALFLNYRGDTKMAALAGQIREDAIARTRRVFPLKEFCGVEVGHIQKMEAAGILNVEHMLAVGKTPADRQELAIQTGIPQSSILELVKLSDLSRLGGVKGIRARLYHDAGADTPQEIAQWEPEALREMLAAFVERTGFPGIAPLPKEVRSTVEASRKLPRIIQYE